MQVDKKYKIEQAASKDPCRTNITNPYYDDSRGCFLLVATNGRILAAVPVEQDEGDVAGYVSVDSLKAARKLMGKWENDAVVRLSGDREELIDGTSKPRINPGTFPDWRECMPSPAVTPTMRVGINAKRLCELAQALGSDEIILNIDDREGAILVEVKDDKAVGTIVLTPGVKPDRPVEAPPSIKKRKVPATA